ncbi:MAG: hypothetical protein LGR52_11535 [Candidatus Thiosymbion ectosymbiont of Robbea hypermnestra]|nr:hypothetical protein [Candidatus Thiosymbion ectosymbiont of Robbea hypermnestra]
MGVEYLSDHEIQRQLEELTQNQPDLERALAQHRQLKRLDLAQEIEDLIWENGFEADEVLPLIVLQRKHPTDAEVKERSDLICAGA